MNSLRNGEATKSHNRRRMLPLIAALSLGLAAIGASLGEASAMPQIPFSSSIAGTVVGPNGADFSLAASGIATSLGKTTQSGVGQITGGDGVTTLTDELTETLTAANGDTLVLHCQQVATVSSPGVFEATDQWTVVGGTGRFSGATGAGTGTTHVDLNAHTFTKASKGTISIGK